MRQDDETSAVQLYHLLLQKGHPLSLRTILRCRKQLGWTFRGSKYCQLIRHTNKIKRLDWAKQNEDIMSKIEDIVWTDESTIQLETHRRFCCRKKGEPPKTKPRYVSNDLTLYRINFQSTPPYLTRVDILRSPFDTTSSIPYNCCTCNLTPKYSINNYYQMSPPPPHRAKHPVKVHVWAGISWQGATEICIFEGKMNAPLFVSILERTLLPFLHNRLPDGHKFMQDNDPKHTSRLAQAFFAEKGVNWWRTPAESPDLNPIENMWHELKEYIRREVRVTQDLP